MRVEPRGTVPSRLAQRLSAGTILSQPHYCKELVFVHLFAYKEVMYSMDVHVFNLYPRENNIEIN